MVRILLCGDVRGRLKQVCEAITRLQSKLNDAQKFQAVFCVGEFSADEMELDVTPPVPMHFIDSGPAAQDLIDESPQGNELAPNLHFLGHYGIATIAGLKVGFLSGKQCTDLFENANDNEAEEEEVQIQSADRPGSAEDLRNRYGVQEGDSSLNSSWLVGKGESSSSKAPSWEELKAKEKVVAFKSTQLFIDGCYTPLALERLQEEIADSGGIDLLLTSEWPKGILRNVPQAWPEEAENRRMVKKAAKHCSSMAVAEIAAAAEPKYHAVGLGGVFWRRQPWKHERRGEIVPSTGEMQCGVCRLISLGAVDGTGPGVSEDAPKGPQTSASEDTPAKQPTKAQKWVHGLDLDPNSSAATANDATLCPWSEKCVNDGKGADAGNDGPIRLAALDPEDKEERRRWLKRFGCLPDEMQKLQDKIDKANAPKEKKEKHKSLYKVSDKEKKRRKTGGDGHLPFHAKERMASKG